MLPKEKRLNRKEILTIQQRKLPIIQGNYFGLVFSPVSNEQKFGVIVSTKIAKRAVVRNKLRRMLYQKIQQTPLDCQGWFLFLAKKSALEAKPADLEKELLYFKGKINYEDTNSQSNSFLSKIPLV
jgi:ribonuclease P protein component